MPKLEESLKSWNLDWVIHHAFWAPSFVELLFTRKVSQAVFF